MLEYCSFFKRFFVRVFFVERNFRFKEVHVSCFFDICVNSKNDPEMVISVKMRSVRELMRIADSSFHCWRKKLMHRGAVTFLNMKKFDDKILSACRIIWKHSHYILRAVTETETASAETELIKRKIARPVFRHVALARIVNVDHAVHVGIWCLDLKNWEIFVPEFFKSIKCRVNISAFAELLDIRHIFFNRRSLR